MPQLVTAAYAAIQSFWAWATAAKVGFVTVAGVIKVAAGYAASMLLSRALAPRLPNAGLTATSPLQLARTYPAALPPHELR